jgi:hypothetical protein
MFARFAPPLASAARRPLIWLMVLALWVYGQSSAIVQMLGPAHRHAVVATSGAPAWLDGVEAVFKDIRTWRDSLHEQLLPDEAVHAHPHPGETWAAQAHAAGAVEAHVQGAGVRQHAHHHFHSVSQRHHHDPLDPSVVTLDRDGPDMLADASAQASAGSASLTLGLATAVKVPSPAATPLAWNREAPATWADALPRLLERPPRA